MPDSRTENEETEEEEKVRKERLFASFSLTSTKSSREAELTSFVLKNVRLEIRFDRQDVFLQAHFDDYYVIACNEP